VKQNAATVNFIILSLKSRISRQTMVASPPLKASPPASENSRYLYVHGADRVTLLYILRLLSDETLPCLLNNWLQQLILRSNMTVDVSNWSSIRWKTLKKLRFFYLLFLLSIDGGSYCYRYGIWSPKIWQL